MGVWRARVHTLRASRLYSKTFPREANRSIFYVSVLWRSGQKIDLLVSWNPDPALPWFGCEKYRNKAKRRTG